MYMTYTYVSSAEEEIRPPDSIDTCQSGLLSYQTSTAPGAVRGPRGAREYIYIYLSMDATANPAQHPTHIAQ
jgi:hypothetical protein